MAHDVFISYATADKATADAVCARLEQNGIRCWIAPRDILPSAPWKPSIVSAIHASRALVLIFSAHANESTEVPKEVDQAVKKGVSIVAFRIENVPPASGLDYELHGRHWLDALSPPLERHIDELTVTLNALLGRAQETASQKPAAVLPSVPAPAPGKSSRIVVMAAIAILAVAGAGTVGWFVANMTQSNREAPPANVGTRPSEPPTGSTVVADRKDQSPPVIPNPEPRRGTAPPAGDARLATNRGSVTPPVSAKLPPAASGRPSLEALVGEYDAGGARVIIALRSDGVLTSAIEGQPAVELEFASGLRYTLKGWPQISVEFLRDSTGVISGLISHQLNGDVRAVRVSRSAPPATTAPATADRKPDVPPPHEPAAAVVSKPSTASAGGGARLVGCWGVGGSTGPLVVAGDHSFTSGGVIKGRWDEAGDIFFMQFPDDVGQAELSNDGRRLALTGKVTWTLVRPNAGPAIVGDWKFGEGNPLTMTFAADGSFVLGAVNGKWRAAGANARVFAVMWPGSRYSTVVNPDNQSLTMSDPAYGTTTVLKRLPCGAAPPGRR